MNGILLPRNCFHFPLVKVIVSKIAYIKLENSKNEHFFTTKHRKVARENFSGTSDGSYWSKSWRDWSGISIAPTFERIRRVEATNDVTEERSHPMSRKLPLKKRTLGQHQTILLQMRLEDIAKWPKKCIFSEIKKFPTLLNQNLDVFSMDNVFSDVLDIDEE